MSTFGIYFVIFWMALFKPCIPAIVDIIQTDFIRWHSDDSETNICAANPTPNYSQTKVEEFCERAHTGSTPRCTDIGVTMQSVAYTHKIVVCEITSRRRTIIVNCISGYYDSTQYLLWQYNGNCHSAEVRNVDNASTSVRRT